MFVALRAWQLCTRDDKAARLAAATTPVNAVVADGAAPSDVALQDDGRVAARQPVSGGDVAAHVVDSEDGMQPPSIAPSQSDSQSPPMATAAPSSQQSAATARGYDALCLR